MRLAERLQGFDAYLGTEMNMRLTRMRAEGKDVINLGLGDPDVQPSEGQRQTLADACLDVNSHHYPSFYSPKPFKEAISVWMIPGSMYGAHGEGYFRIALTHPAARLAEAMERLKRFIA